MILTIIVALNIIYCVNANLLSAHPYGSLTTDNKGYSVPDMRWTGADFTWPCSTTRALFKGSGKYINKNNIATRAQIYRDTFFVVFPRFKTGVPATLVKTKLKKGACSTTFEPFPCWSMQEEGKCSAMQSVVDLVLDGEVLWVLGNNTTLKNNKY